MIPALCLIGGILIGYFAAEKNTQHDLYRSYTKGLWEGISPPTGGRRSIALPAWRAPLPPSCSLSPWWPAAALIPWVVSYDWRLRSETISSPPGGLVCWVCASRSRLQPLPSKLLLLSGPRRCHYAPLPQYPCWLLRSSLLLNPRQPGHRASAKPQLRRRPRPRYHRARPQLAAKRRQRPDPPPPGTANPDAGPGLLQHAFPCGAPVEADLDLWPLVAPLVPLLEELERIEAMAAGENDNEDPPAIAYAPDAD